jgi:hypothetical protein
LLASGADIWNALLNGRSVEEIADWLARGAEEERMRIAAEVAQFVSGTHGRKPYFIDG